MSNNNFREVEDLLQEAQSKGMIISFTGNDLIVKYAKEKKPDQLFVDKLKNHKGSLCAYFKWSGDTEPKEPVRTAPAFFQNGKAFYEVGLSQQYWVDERIDKEYKEKLFGLIKYRMTGDFNVNAFNRSIAYIVNRHESLRACFCQTGDDCYMNIRQADDPVYAVDYHDFRNHPMGEEDINHLIYFSEHKFNIAEGPLFLVRLLRLKEEEYLLAIKLHHAIYDAWTVDVLIKDIILAYVAFVRQQEPPLKELNWQYKDYMSFILAQQKAQYEENKKHWSLLYEGLPSELIIPGANKSALTRSLKVCRSLTLPVHKNLVIKLQALSNKYATTLFVLLQAYFKFYLYHITGQNDITVATEIFGRHLLRGAEDQIGFYSQMRILRTIFDDKYDLGKAIQLVKRSNEDMQRVTGFSLMDYLGALNGCNGHVMGKICKVSLNYTDENGYYLNKKALLADVLNEVTFEPYYAENDVRHHIAWDFDVHFYKLRERIDVTVIYDTGLYDQVTMQTLIRAFIDFMESGLEPNSLYNY